MEYAKNVEKKFQQKDVWHFQLRQNAWNVKENHYK